MKRATLLLAVVLGTACASTAALAHVDVGVFLGAPAPLYVEQPAVVYQAPPPVVYSPAPVYYGYGNDIGYREERRWHDNGRHRGWEHRRHNDDDD